MNGYLGLTQPFDTVWSNGRNVTVFPDGKVVDRNNGYLVRNSDRNLTYRADTPTSNFNTEKDTEKIFSNPNNLMVFAVIALVAIVAIVAVSKK